MKKILVLFLLCLVFQVSMAQYQTNTSVTMRDGAASYFPSKGSLAKGTKVVIKGSKGDWTFVEANGRLGYIPSSAISKSKSVVHHYDNTGDNSGRNQPTVVSQHSTKVLTGEEIYQKYNKAVFQIFTTDGENVYSGSGFFINNKGWAVSNYHVFEDATAAFVYIPSTEEILNIKKIVARSAEPDYIVFQVDVTDNPYYIPLERNDVRVGQKVYAIGSPKNLSNTLSSGEISGMRSEFMIQTSVNIDHGSSGGALINEYGRAVGITSGTLDKTSNANLNYAWSIKPIFPFLNLK